MVHATLSEGVVVCMAWYLLYCVTQFPKMLMATYQLDCCCGGAALLNDILISTG